MEYMSVVEKYMQRAMELALKGKGHVSPNPMVGCVIVKDDIIIGEGWHEQHGGPHAEVNAINAVSDKSMLNGAFIYVTLEPCAHFGKTPPCADLIIQYPFKKVIIANVDPNPQVSGRGIERIQKAGIAVEIGVLKEEGERLNARFFKNQRQQMPYVILKWAQTTDGFVARNNYDSKWISDEFSRHLVHQWRSEEDAILVGKNTVLHDNPLLTTRGISNGKNPIRVVLDTHLALSNTYQVFNTEAQTMVLNELKDLQEGNVKVVKLENIKSWNEILQALYKQGVCSVLIEGGSAVLHSIIEQELWDEARVFVSPNTFLKGISAPTLSQNFLQAEQTLMQDRLLVYRNY
jgi:diaminohydroxyphosphoribosylaminopyrimidine deaminase/5-amino-6-(5-phosphoribosylamino)uracil reductase